MRSFRINKIVLFLLLSDAFILTGFGLIDPIIAIYIDGNVQGGSIFAAGLASTIFFVTKSVIQLPFSRYVDTHDNKIKWLLVGSLLIALVPFIYIAAPNIYFIYLAQLVYGIGSGLAYPTWLGLWSTHLDKKHESFEWSLYSTTIGIGTAASASIGAALSDFMGFRFTFIVVGIMSLLGCAVLYALEKQRHTRALLANE
jgi:DHA1 family quinolone resistance protein-like MFS transporter